MQDLALNVVYQMATSERLGLSYHGGQEIFLLDTS